MNEERLRLDLNDLADEVDRVDLRDRALRTSRRLGIQRTIATSAAALVLIAAATGAALAIRPERALDPMPADSPTISISPSPTPDPTPSPSTSSLVAPPPDGSSGTTVTFGRLVYGPASSGGDYPATGHLLSWQPGDAPDRLLDLPFVAALTNATVSPDGRRAAWVEDNGALWVANVDGSGRRKLSDGVDNNCGSPAWLPNSRQLTVRLNPAAGASAGAGLLDVSSGAYTKLPVFDGCHAVWAAASGTLAFAGGSSTAGVVITDRTGAGRRTIPGLGGKSSEYVCFDIASLAPDGRRIALFRIKRDSETYGDAGRDLIANAVLDTRTGKAVTLPLGGRQMRQVFFQSDGSMVVRLRSNDRYTLLLVDENGKKVGEQPEPTSLRNMQIVNALD
ncbi:TolB family protein [Micromonospora arborensis]|uniref:TolB family protein n=1 Tax=Micromonospora arborensis TaxID=2116518 RepID=UPI00371D61D1